MGAEGKMDLALAPNQNADAARAALTSRPPHLPLTRTVLRDLVRSPKPGRGRAGPTVLTSRKSMSTTNLFDVGYYELKFIAILYSFLFE